MNESINKILLAEGILEITGEGFKIEIIPPPYPSSGWGAEVVREGDWKQFAYPTLEQALVAARNFVRKVSGKKSLEEEAAELLERTGPDFTVADGACPDCGQTIGLYRWARVRTLVPFADPSRVLLDLQAPIQASAEPLTCVNCLRSFVVQ